MEERSHHTLTTVIILKVTEDEEKLVKRKEKGAYLELHC